jgi:hypothetical protein
MRKLIVSLISVIAAMAALKAQQVSPNQATTTLQASKPKAAGTRPLSQPRIQPTQATTPNNNPGRDKRIVPDSSGNRKPVVNNPGHAKPPMTILGTQLLPRPTAGTLPKTIMIIMRRQGAATTMNGMTAIGGNNIT